MRGPGRGWSSASRYCENDFTRGLENAICSAMPMYSAWRVSDTPTNGSGVLWTPNSVEVDALAVAQRARLRRPVERAHQPRDDADRHVVLARRLVARAGALRVGMVRVAVGVERAAARALVPARVQAQRAAQERERLDHVLVADRRGLAHQDLVALVAARAQPLRAGLEQPAGRSRGEAGRPWRYCGLRKSGWLGSFQIDHRLTRSP